ncbi:DNA-binding protein [Candidatus Marinimicrobia bacterium PRS2]|nr:DNA-binding protein [Candidatus Marinimicrobia bacterium PRS2]
MENKIIQTLQEIKSLVQGKGSNQWVDIREVSNLTSTSKSTIRRAVSRGDLTASKRTGKLLFKVSDIERWLNG